MSDEDEMAICAECEQPIPPYQGEYYTTDGKRLCEYCYMNESEDDYVN